MGFSPEAALIVENTRRFAAENQYEYIMPEMLLLSMCDDEVFCEAFTECDGNIKKLSKDLKAYIKDNCEKTKNGECELTLAMHQLMPSLMEGI